MGIKQSKLIAMILTLSILLLNCQQVVSYAEAVISRKEPKSELKIEQESTISAINDVQANNILGQEISYIGKSKAITQKPYITRISKSQISMGSYYQATINIYGQAKSGTTVYANIGHQEASQRVGTDQTFGFTLNTISKNITIEFYAIDSNGSKSESVFVTCTPDGDYISNNGTYPTNNTPPVISSNDKVFNLGTDISNDDLLKDVTAYDEEDGDLTSKIVIKEHNINSNLAGTYRVTYKVTDSEGETTEKENKVQIVNPNLNKGFLYNIYRGSVTIEGYIGDKTDVVIPDTIEGYPVTSIGNGAFDKNSDIISVKIPSSVTEINGNAFRDCINLESVNIPDGVTVIQGGAFNNCKSLKSIKIPESVTKIEVYSFNNCSSLTEVEIPKNVTFIGYNSFTGCTSLEKVIIPKSVKTIERNTFSGNSNLKIYGYKNSYAEQYAKDLGIKFVYINENNTPPVISSNDKVFNLGTNISNNDLLKDVTAYDEEDGDLTSKIVIKEHNINSNLVGIYRVIYKVTDSNGEITEKENKVEIINPNANREFLYNISGGSVTIEGYIGDKTNVVIPDTIEGYPVKSIAYGAFRDNKNIVSVTIPSGITQLNGYTFSGCSNLTTVKIPDSLIYIYDNVFEDCIKLKNINIPNKVKLIYVYAFKGCSSLENINLPNSLEEIGYGAFLDCTNLKNINIPKNINKIQKYTFYNCKTLTEVEILEGVLSIEYGAFYGCSNLKKVTVPKSVLYLGNSIFTECSRELKIYGYKNSAVEKYAKDLGLNFVYIKETNTLPNINAKDLEAIFGESINLMDGVSASDEEDGDITSNIKIVENTVNMLEVGVYKVVYEVEDSDGNKVRKEIKVTIKPESVSNVEAKSNSYSSNKVTWSSIDNIDGYEVYRATSKNGTYSLRKTVTSQSSLSYTNTGLTTGKTYYYKVRAYKVVNGENLYSDFSEVASAKPQLSSPTGKASSASYNSNKVTWNKVAGADGYEIYRATSQSGSYSLKKTVASGSNLSYTNTGLTTGKTYYYKVRAYRLVNGKKVYSNYSDIVSSKPKLTTPTLTLSSGTKKVYVKWNKISGASGYEVYRGTSKSGTYKRVKTISKGSTSTYTNSGLSSKKGYYYKVRAYKTVNGKKVYSSYSSIKYIKTK